MKILLYPSDQEVFICVESKGSEETFSLWLLASAREEKR